jgi:hypothetical protein
LRIINLASPGAGPLYNRFFLEHFLRKHRARNLLYVVDSFAFASGVWNEDRFADAKLVRATPFEPAIARLLAAYVRNDGVSAQALFDYVAGFSKVNNRDRFQRDSWEGEAQFERIYRPSTSAVRKRIAYLYPAPPKDQIMTRYLQDLTRLAEIAQQNGVRVVAVKLPLPALFRSQLPNETAFDAALAPLLEARRVPLYDFSGEIQDPRYYFDTDHLNRAGLTELMRLKLKSLLLALDSADRRATASLCWETAYEGKSYSSLSEIARLTTGTRWKGPKFFGMQAAFRDEEEPANGGLLSFYSKRSLRRNP